jgi:hypothetical protein
MPFIPPLLAYRRQNVINAATGELGFLLLYSAMVPHRQVDLNRKLCRGTSGKHRPIAKGFTCSGVKRAFA